jgi:NitT/TauT family transport system permease protein
MSGAAILPAERPARRPARAEAYDGRTLNTDLIALAALFFAAICHHLNNPLLIFETQFGSAFRNATLQPVIAVGLIACALALIVPALRERRGAIAVGASVVLLAYCAYAALAILFGINLSGALTGVDPALFTARLTADTPRDGLTAALALSTPLAWLALAAIVVLWQPWTRLAVYRRSVGKQTAALAVGALVLIAWEVLIDVFQIQQFLLPKPSVIAAAFANGYPRLVSAGWNTFQNAFWGFVIGCGAGILVGMVSARFTGFSRALLPIAIGINAVPIIAIAPLMNNWFGALNPASKIGIVALLTFFPAMISTVRGLTSVDALSLELMHTYAARPLAVFRKLRLPNALPFIFSALKVATTLSMIGAIVSEYFGGSTAGLGFRIRDDAGLFKYPEAWAAIFIASVYGILFYLLISVIERALMSWHVSFRET